MHAFRKRVSPSRPGAAPHGSYRKLPPPEADKALLSCTGGMVARVKRLGNPRRSSPMPCGLMLVPPTSSPAQGSVPRLRDFLEHNLAMMPEAGPRARRWLPGALAQWFPRREAAGAPPYYSVRALEFALQLLLARGEGLHKTPALRHFLRAFCATLGAAADGIVETMGAGAARRAGAIDAAAYTQACAAILAPLQRGEAVLLQAGYVGIRWTHTISLYFTPTASDSVIWAVIDRADDASEFHPVDDAGRAQPLVFATTRAALCTPAAHAAVQALIELDDSPGPSSIDDFHVCIGQLREATCSRVLLGKGRPQALTLPGQRGQKAGTCTLHSLFGALHLALHQHFGSLSPTASSEQRAHVQAVYKTLKLHCRAAILQQMTLGLAQAEAQGDTAACAALREVLDGATAYLRDRLGKPHKHTAELLAAGAPKKASPPPAEQSQRAAVSALR